MQIVDFLLIVDFDLKQRSIAYMGNGLLRIFVTDCLPIVDFDNIMLKIVDFERTALFAIESGSIAYLEHCLSRFLFT